MPARASLTAILMAKWPAAGMAKTRLGGPEGLTDDQAAQVARAMLICTASRLASRWPLVVAVSPDERAADMQALLEGHVPAGVACTGQGKGDLGERLARIWAGLAADKPVAFFGIDSPDVPAEALDAIPGALADAHAAIGPTPDGGYWTLATRTHSPELVRKIDWGGPNVYDQTVARADSSGLSHRALPEWWDIDHPADLDALRQRLAGATDCGNPHDAAALKALRSSIEMIFKERQ